MLEISIKRAFNVETLVYLVTLTCGFAFHKDPDPSVVHPLEPLLIASSS